MIKNMVEGLSKMMTAKEEIADDILMLKFKLVNAFMLGKPKEDWILVDTGIESSYDYIITQAEERFGKDNFPKAIILTHAHFDHVGSLIELASHWPVPVYAHKHEIPFITGEAEYPEVDTSDEEGLVGKIASVLAENQSINIGYQAEALPEDNSIPGIKGWRYIHTPGHTPGHISLFKEEGRILICGDLITTTNQNSFFSVLTDKEDVKGPPSYLTTDWSSVYNSIRKIHALNPQIILPSHGKALKGEELTKHLTLLVNNFQEQAIPNEKRL